MATNQKSTNAAGDIPHDILIVDDEMPNLKLLTELLGREGYQVRPADSPQIAIDSALGQPPKLILLDVRMPEMDGFEVCRRLKQDERTRNVPVIFISALHEVEDKLRGFEVGGVDFITKPFQEPEVLARVRTHAELRNLHLNLGELVDERTAELAKSEAKYRGLVDNSMAGVFTTTLDGRFTFVNDAMVKIFDFDSTELMIAHGSLERWRDLKDRERMLAELQKHGSVTNFEAETITHTGRHIQVLFSVKKIGNSISGMVMDISDRKQAEQKIIDYQQRLKSLASQLTIVEESERRRIAADLHDQVGQSLALALLQIAVLRKQVSDSGQIETFDEISDSLQQTVQETRDVIYDLSPPQLNEIGLSAAVSEWLEEHVGKRHGIKAECTVSATEKQLDTNLRSILFRNTRELVTNVIKHAQATEVKISISQENDNMNIIVRDDGIGFDADAGLTASNNETGFGLFSIRERMTDLGGSLKIISKPGKGTEAILSMPVKQQV